MGKYAEMSKLILQHMGGVGNITHVTHCATRLRIDYADKKLVDAGALKELPEAAGVVVKPGQIQVIIGAKVNDAYNEFLTVSGWHKETPKDEDEGPHNFSYWVNRFGNFAQRVSETERK